ncbi:MAG: YcxB family protein [Planctomycetota bacterium]|jgi:hypothetical protein
MEVEYSLELEDLLAFNLYHNAHSPAIRRVQRTVRLAVLTTLVAVLTTLAIVCVVLSGLGHETLGTSAWIAFSLFIGLVGAILFFSHPARVRQRTRRLAERMYREGENRGLFTRRRMTITPETITDATEISVTTMKWVAVEKIAVDRRHAYFYVSAASAFTLPKAAFATEEGFQEFIETARRYQRDAPG